jgi:hypothetical protein
MPFKGIYMGELNQLMLEHEEFLESSLDDMEYGGELTQEQVADLRLKLNQVYDAETIVTLKSLHDRFAPVLDIPFVAVVDTPATTLRQEIMVLKSMLEARNA